MSRTSANDNRPVANQIRFAVEPRLVPVEKAARRLHLTTILFKDKATALYQAGFPLPCSVTGHYDLLAIDGWLDRRAGLTPANVAAVASFDDFESRLAALE